MDQYLPIVAMLVLATLFAAVSFAASAQSKDNPPPSGWNTPQTVPSASGKMPAPAAATPAAPAPKTDEALPLPMPGAEQPQLDLTLLKDTSLCVFPFVKESAAGSSDKKYLEAIQRTFFEVAKDSPLVLLTDHLDGDRPILVYRVTNLAQTVAVLHSRGWPKQDTFEIPHGPCCSFRTPGGHRVAIYQLIRPEAAAHFEGRRDF